MNRVIFNADDFGIHEEVNQAVIDACRHGVLRSTSLVANGPAFDEAVELAKECPELGIGIQLCLTGPFSPILSPKEVPSLVEQDGLFPDTYAAFMKRSMIGQLQYTDVYRELDGQMEKIMAAGLSITHVDSSRHIHMLPQIWPIVQALMKKYGIHRVRIPRESPVFQALYGDPGRLMARNGLTLLGKRAMLDVQRFGFMTTDYFWGSVDTGQVDEKKLVYLLQRLPFGVHEIMMHPGKHEDILRQQFSWGYHWEDEYKALLSPVVRDLMTQRNIQSISFGNLP